jgi:hypothetical protein
MRLEKIFLRISILFALYISAITGLAVFGYFAKLPVIVSTIFFLLACIYFIVDVARKTEGGRVGKVPVITFLIIVGFCLVIGFFHHDLPTGRDDLSYIFAADRLVVSHSLQWEDYFSRPVHGVRNLEGNIFTSQFLPTYTTYLGVYSLFGGLDAMMWANVLLMIFTFGIFYYLLKSLAGSRAPIVGILMMLSSYVFFWFPKRTNSENISIFLIWLSVWLTVSAIYKKKISLLVLAMIPYSLLLLTRPEGMIFFVCYCIAFIYLILNRTNKLFLGGRIPFIVGSAATAFNLLIFYFYILKYKAGYIVSQAVDVFEEFDFIYQRTGILLSSILLGTVFVILIVKFKSKINFQKLLFWSLIIGIIIFEAIFIYSIVTDNLRWLVYRTQYVLENFVFYFYFIYILIILFGLKKKLYGRQEFVMALILLPAFFFIIEPNIALDQPWFMRRFYPTLIPLFVILSAVILIRLNIAKRKLWLLTAAFILIGIVTTGSIFTFVENRGLRGQIESFNEIFPEDSLVVMNRGWNWQKIAVLQHYFYDIDALPNIDLYRSEEMKKDLPTLLATYPNWQTSDEDLLAIMNWEDDEDERLFTELLDKYNQVYIITNETNTNLFRGFDDSNLQYVDSYLFQYNELGKESNITGYIQKNELISISKIRSLQNSIPPSNINTAEIDLRVYRVVDNSAYIPYEYVLEITDDLDKGVNYVLSQPSDLLAYRNNLQSLVRNAEVYSE